MAIVATGFVRVRVLSNTLGNDIKRAVERSLGGMDADMRRHGQRLGRQLARGTREGFKDSAKQVEEEAEKVGERAGTRIVRGTRRNLTGGLANSIVNAFRTGARRSEPAVVGAFQGMATRLGGRLFRMFGGRFVSKAFGGLSGALSGLLGGIKAFAKPEITSWFWSMGTALTTMIVPALGWITSNAGRGIGILAAGFSSLAISAGLFALALAQGGPAMEEFKDKWKEIGKIVGEPILEEFLNRTNDGMERLKTLAQQLEPEFRDLGAAWGDAFDTFTGMLGTEKSLGNIQRILKTSAKTTRDFGTATSAVVDGFLTLLAHAEPLVNYVSEGAVKMGEWFRNTMDAKAASGELDQTMQRTLTKWQQTWETIKDFGSGIRNIFRAASPITERFGDSMSRIAEKFQTWTSNPANQERMTQFFEKAYTISGKVADVLGDLAVMAGRAFEKLDEDKIIRVLEIFQDKLIPAIQGFYNQFKGQNAEQWVQFFDNMASVLQRIVDSGAIETVGGFVADMAVKFSELLNNDAAGWFLGVYLALQPLQGLLTGIVPLLASLFYGLRIAQMMGGSAAAAGAAGTAAGAAGAGAGAAAAGGFLAGWKGILKGGIVAFIAGEILSAASEDFSVAWDSLWSGVFDAGGKALGAVGDALSVPVNYFSAFIHKGLGDSSAAQADIDRANAQIKEFFNIITNLDNWSLTHTNDPNSPTGNTILDKYVVDENKATQFKQSWDQVATNVRNRIAEVGEAFGAGREVVSVKYNSILNELNKVPSTPALDSLKKSIGISMQNIATEFANGDENIHNSINSLYEMMIIASQQDPSFEPTRLAIAAQLQGIEKEFTLSKIPEAFTGMISNLQSAGDVDVGTGFGTLRDNIVTQLGDLSLAIETRSADVPAKITAMMDLINQIPADAPPSLLAVKEEIVAKLTEIGYGAQVAGAQAGSDAAAAVKQIETNVAGALKGISEITLPEPEWANMRWDMKPLYNNIQKEAASLGEAITAGSADLPARVQSMVDLLNSVPADAPPQLQSLKQDITRQLQALGYSITADGQIITQNMANSMSNLTNAASTGAEGIGTGIAQKLREGSSLTQAEMDTAIAALTGKVSTGLGGTVPGAISATGPALSGAMLKATQGIPLTVEEQFALANAQAASQAMAMPGAITPGLAGVVGKVASALSPVPDTGSSPFSALGTSLAGIVGGFAGKIIPGLNKAADQPPSKFSPIPGTGVAPWLSMSSNIIGAMNNMNASVARVLAAVAAVVVAAWAVIGRANAAGLAGTLATVNATVAAAHVAQRATATVVDQVNQIARMMIAIGRAVIEAREAKDRVAQYASEAAAAVVRAASAASTAAGAAANAANAAANAAAARSAAAASAAAVPAAEGGIFNPTPGGTLTLIAEAGRRERVEPLDSQGLSRRDRAMIGYIVSQISVAHGGGNTKVVVTLDGRELSGVVSSVVTSRMDNEARQLKQRRRRSA